MQLSNFKKAAIQVGALMAVAAVLALWSCEKPPLNTDEAKKTVYNYLDAFSKDIIVGTWRTARYPKLIWIQKPQIGISRLKMPILKNT